MSSAPSVAVALLGAVVGALTLAGCEAVLGLGGESSADAGAPREGGLEADAKHDAVDVATEHEVDAGGAAVQVSSDDLSANWCAVTRDGDVECWGNNDSGQLGDGTTKPSATPKKVEGIAGPAVAVSVGLGTVCAVTRAGGAYCWGEGLEGELGNGSTPAQSSRAVPVKGLESGVTAISSGQRVVCAVQKGSLLCWGDGVTRLLGTGSTSVTSIPAAVMGMNAGVTDVSVGINVACAVKASAAYCWGAFDQFGELGNGTLDGSLTPVAVQGLGSVASISAGAGFVCAVEATGGVKCWGNGAAGALGNGELTMSPSPLQVRGLTSGVSAVSAGAVSACALQTSGGVVCWGYAADGELGNGSAEADSTVGPTSTVPVPASLKEPAVSITTGQAPCVATRSGKVECWGIIAEDDLAPVPVPGLVTPVTLLTTGGDLSTEQYACAIDGTGFPFCWGGNGAGQFGNGFAVGSNAPTKILELPSGATDVAAGAGVGTTCGVFSGRAYCWGNNDFGQLGDATQTSSKTDQIVRGLTSGVLSVAVGTTFACALTQPAADAGTGGAVLCWGDNSSGQLGNGTATSSNVPVPVTGLSSGVTAISIGTYSVCALMTDGTVRCWGANDYGQLGNGTMATSLTPMPVPGVTGATAISVGWWAACAVTGGSILCWGDNTFGELGNNTAVSNSTTPVAVYGIPTGATAVSVGQTSVCAVVSGGAQCWGLGPVGNGAAPITSYNTPQPVMGLATGVTAVSSAAWFACAIANTNVECWGFNTAGEIGNNSNAEDAFEPVRISGFP